MSITKLPPHLQVAWDFIQEKDLSRHEVFQLWLEMDRHPRPFGNRPEDLDARILLFRDRRSAAYRLLESLDTEQLAGAQLSQAQMALFLEFETELGRVIQVLREQANKNSPVAAYLVGIVNTRTLTLEGARIFSEASPTMMGGRWPFTIIEGYGKTYEEGRQSILDTLASASSWFGWARALLDQGDLDDELTDNTYLPPWEEPPDNAP